MEAAQAANEASKKAKVEASPQQESGTKKRKGGRTRKKEAADDSEDNDEEQEDCSAKPKCLRPVGKEVRLYFVFYMPFFFFFSSFEIYFLLLGSLGAM